MGCLVMELGFQRSASHFILNLMLTLFSQRFSFILPVVLIVDVITSKAHGSVDERDDSLM